jgi:hypothetical protein
MRKVIVSKRIYDDNRRIVAIEKDYEGLFHGWASDFEEFESGPGNTTVAIVERKYGTVKLVCPELIQFVDEQVSSVAEPTRISLDSQKTIKIRVDFYKETGKWYEGCDMDIPEGSQLFAPKIEDYIRANQTAVNNPEQFYMVVNNIDSKERMNDPFFMRLYKPEER